MTISTMGKKCVVLCLAMCLVLSSFHEVSCQVEGIKDVTPLDDQNFLSNLNNNLEEEESESSSITKEKKISWGQSSESTEEDTSSVYDDNSTESEDLSGNAEGSGLKDKAEREMEEAKAQRQKEMEDFRRRQMEVKAGSTSEYVKETELTKKKTKVETRETVFGESEDENADDGSDINQIYYGKQGEKESASSRQQYESNKNNGGSGIIGSLGLGQSAGSWRCINQDKNGAKDDDDVPIVIPKYNINDIIKEESLSQGSTKKTSSLEASLSKIVEKHTNKKWTSTVEIGKNTHKSKETVRLETVEKLKVTLKKYRSLSVHELVDRSDFEEILAIAAHYEEVSLAKVSHISKLSMYKSVIIDGKKASKEVKLAQTRIEVHKGIVKDKKKNVEAEYAAIKALAKRGDNLSVRIFGLKQEMLKLEAEKEEVNMNFQKATENLTRILEEASKAEEEYHVVVRKWKQEKSYAQYSEETIQSAEYVWVQFLNTLEATSV